jgi:hypothetical protein
MFGEASAVERARSGSVISMNRVWSLCLVFAAGLAVGSCTHVRPSQREKLANPAMQFQMEPAAESQRDSILEITEGATFPSAGPGTAGAGCGCN